MASRIPTLKRGVDVYSLPLNTKEGFVLSRIDDVASVDDIAMMVGLKVTELMTILDRLADLGAVELPWRPVSNKPAAPPPRPSMSAAAPGSEVAGLRGEAHPAVQRALAPPPIQPYTEGELEEPGDLTDAQKRRVLIAFYGIEGRTFYELLGVDANADKKTIRSAYFELSRLFHPDSMFGKDLGSFRSKMETVFKRLTEAYEVLGRGQRRKEYDDYLASTATTNALQNSFDRVESQVRALSTAPPGRHSHLPPPARQATGSAPAPAAASPSTPAVSSSMPAATSSSSSPAAASARATVSSPAPARQTPAPPGAPDPRRASQVGQRPPISMEERKAQARERLRRSFAGAGQIGAGSSRPGAARPARTSQPSAASSSDRARAAARQSAVGAGGVEAVLAHLRRAKDAEAAGDLLGAAAALQAALALQPEHKDLQAQYERVSGAVTRKLADNYEKQARYEEKQAKWAAAALSWERVSHGRPESDAAARAVAEALLKASGDVNRAQQYAMRAVDIAPNDPANVVILARVFIAAGARGQARQALEKAVKLDPHNAMIKDLLREVR